jgi:deazaflavin-dependent oxidoreductase (nitroreductase family)
VSGFDRKVLDAAAREREVTLTTKGRKSGTPVSVTIWVSTDGRRIFIRSGGGLARQWPQNLQANGRATLRLGDLAVEVKPRHVTAPAEARAISEVVRHKYGSFVKPSRPEEPLTQGEQATFELLPAG